MNMFIGADLGWYGKPSGLASLALEGSALRLRAVTRLEDVDEILDWIQTEAGGGSAVVAVDAPLIIRNQSGIRPAERELNADYRRFHAGCHAANLGRPFAEKVISFSRRLEALGFGHGASITPRQEGRFQIEVHPHAATVNLFGLYRIVKYKRADGSVIGTSQIIIEPDGKLVATLFSFPGLSGVVGQRGVVDFAGGSGPIAVAALRFGGSAFTGIPLN